MYGVCCSKASFLFIFLVKKLNVLYIAVNQRIKTLIVSLSNS